MNCAKKSARFQNEKTDERALDMRKNKLKSKKRRDFKRQLGGNLFLTPSLIGVCVFMLLPFCVVVYYALIDNPIRKNFVGFENFTRILNNSAFKMAAMNTIKFSAVAVPLAVILSLLLAMLLLSKIPGKTQLRTFYLSPMMVPVASVVLIWQVLFDYNGVVNQWFAHFGWDKIDWMKSSYAQIVIVLLFLWKNLGYNMILFMATLSSIPKEIIEVAKLESATGWQIFWHIKIRYIASTIVFVTIMSLINSFKVFREIYLMTGDYPYDSLYMLQHFMNNTFKSLDYQKLSSAAILMSLVMIVIIAVLFFFENKMSKDLEG